MRKDGLSLLSNRGAVLFLIALRPGITAKEIVHSMFLTRRAVWGIIGDLRHANMLRIRQDGRRHHYYVNLDSRFRHPTLHGIRLRDILGPLVDARGARSSELGPASPPYSAGSSTAVVRKRV